MATAALSLSRPAPALARGAATILSRTYVTAVIAAGAITMAACFPRAIPRPGMALGLLAASALLSLFKLRLPLSTGEATMTMAYAVDFVALLLLGPDAAMVIGVSGVAVQCLVRAHARQPMSHVAFSMAAVAIAVQATGLLWHLLGGTIHRVGLATTVGPMSAVALTYFGVNSVLVAGAIALSSGRSVVEAWRREFLWSAPAFFVAAAVGTTIVIVIAHGAYALLVLLAAAPLYISHRAYRASVERIEGERAHARELAAMVATAQDALARATVSESALVAEKEQLAMERTRMAVTLKTITDAVLTVDAAGQVLLINESAERLAGTAAADAVERPVAELFHAAGFETPAYEAALRRVLTDGLPSRERAELAAAGRIVELSGTPMRDADGRLAGAVWVLRDVTDESRLEVERSKTARLESLGVLAGGLAHDFNNILMGVVGNLSLAQSLVRQQDRPLAQRLREAEAACVRARGVTSQLLTFAKGGSPVKTPASIRDLVVECARFALSGSPVAPRVSAEHDLWSADIDTVQVSQVIHNLVLNAQQAMPQGGTVDLVMRNVVVDEGGLVDALAPGRYVSVAVIDQGPGIKAEHLPHIFEPYFTTKEKGSGLGLAISSSIVRAHGGAIVVGPAPGGAGTRFEVFLPASSGRVVPLAAAWIEPERGHKGRVLLMDDDPMVAEVAQEMLHLIGFDSESAQCGRTAIDMLKAAERAGRPFDVMILDLTVPGGMGGKEAVPLVRRIRPDMPVLVMSGYADNTVLAEHTKFGFDGVLPKPFSIPDLRVAIESATARRAKSRRTARARMAG